MEKEYTMVNRKLQVQRRSSMATVFYSGHCTGIPAFELMKEIMGDKLIALHSGETVI